MDNLVASQSAKESELHQLLAAELARHGNDLWAAYVGELRETDGFQVHAVGPGLFFAELYGGDRTTALDAEGLRIVLEKYVASRRRRSTERRARK